MNGAALSPRMARPRACRPAPQLARGAALHPMVYHRDDPCAACILDTVDSKWDSNTTFTRLHCYPPVRYIWLGNGGKSSSLLSGAHP
jgi:hypothetical protein